MNSHISVFNSLLIETVISPPHEFDIIRRKTCFKLTFDHENLNLTSDHLDLRSVHHIHLFQSPEASNGQHRENILKALRNETFIISLS